jgi:glycosyltransferase involved in cell wall biosynthesis
MGKGNTIPWRPRLSRETIDGVKSVPVLRIRGLHAAMGRPAIQMHRYRRWLRRGLAEYQALHRPPDVLHAMCAIPAGWACTHLKSPLSRPVVVTEHTGPFSLVMKPKAGESYVRAGLARATAVVAVSEHLRRDMLAAGIQRTIEVVANPVFGDFQASAPPAVAANDAGQTVFHGVFVGRLTELKGIRDLLEAATRLAADQRFVIQWHFAGQGPLEEEVRRRFQAEGMDGRLKMHGFCSKGEVARLVRESHFLVLSSHGENCPLAICEALCTGRPVVATRDTGCESLVKDEDGVLCEIGDPQDLAEAIARLLLNYPQWDWQAIAERARARFSPDVVAARYAEIIRDALTRAATRKTR